MSWDQRPDLIYWIFYAPGDTVTPGQVGSFVVKNAVSPRAVAGLQNGTQYALLMNATSQGSAAGPNSQTVMATPRLAGDIWTKGALQGTRNLNALAFNGFGRYVTVGDGTTLFTGDFNYGHTDPVGVTEWFGGPPPATPPTTWFPSIAFPSYPPGGTTDPGFNDDFKAVIFNGSFVALGSNGNVATSVDGVNWVRQHQVLAAGVTGLNGLAFGNILGILSYVAVGSGGQIYTTSDLNVDWKLDTTANTTNDLTSIELLNGALFVTGANGTLLINSGDGNWQPQSTNVTTTLRSVAFMAAAPATFIPPGTSVPVLPVRFVAVGDAGTIITSGDITSSTIAGNVWTVVPPLVAQHLLSVTVGGATAGRFLAVGQGGTVVFGDNVVNGVPVTTGIDWKVASQPQTGDLSSVHFFLGQYLAVGPAGGNAVCH
jgi:hypothetical protein